LLVAATVILLGAVVAAGIPRTVAQGFETARFEGKVRFDQKATVGFTVRGRNVRFRAHDVRLYCADAPGPVRVNLGPTRARLKHGKTFVRIKNQEGATTGSQYVYWVKGRMVGRDRAKGFVYYLETGPDPANTRCTTFGRTAWIAERT
jgi:hypothetical protein